MDVERTIEFILQTQGKYEAQLAGAEERFNRRMEGMAKVVKIGMRMLARNQRQIGELTASVSAMSGKMAELAISQSAMSAKVAELATSQAAMSAKVAELATSQALTDQALRSFIENLQKGRNGH